MDFKPGDVVMLKSGGPQMTISVVEGDNVFCTWFDKMKRFDGRFNRIVLEKCEGFGAV